MASLIDSSFVQSGIQTQIDRLSQEISHEQKEQLDFNQLQLYFGEDYNLNNKIIVRQPTVQDFIDYGENNIWSVVIPFTTNPTGYRVQLWENGIDWNNISEQQLFSALIKKLDPQYSKILFGETIDFRDFNLVSIDEIKRFIPEEIYVNDLQEEFILYNFKEKMILTEDERKRLCRYIQYMFNQFPPREERVKNKTLKKDIINNERQKMLLRMKEASEKETDSSMLATISFCLNHPGFKYKKNELKTMGIVEFLDSVRRLQIYESTHALLSGQFSGFLDTSKIDKEQFNFMRDIKTV